MTPNLVDLLELVAKNIYTTVIKLFRKYDLVVGDEKFARKLRHILFEFQIKEHKSCFQRFFRS